MEELIHLFLMWKKEIYLMTLVIKISECCMDIYAKKDEGENDIFNFCLALEVAVVCVSG